MKGTRRHDDEEARFREGRNRGGFVTVWGLRSAEVMGVSEISNNFTGVLLPVFYVRDTLASAEFYREICGFSTVSFYAAEAGLEAVEQKREELPTFIRMCAASQEFALHLNEGPSAAVGGTKHYFEVKDVDRHRQEIEERGGSPTEIFDLPWMRLFSVTDPDGHILYFQTPNPEWEARMRRLPTREEPSDG